MQLNPILALELRARWRANRSYLLLLGIVLALGLLTGFIYQRAVVNAASASYDPMTGSMREAISEGSARANAVGRELFVAIAHVNIIAWLFIAAGSAATGIARERERGLLESLQLSHMSAPDQLAARFGAGFLLLALLQLVLLPIYAVAFLMGGVSPLEVAQAFGLVLVSALTGTSLGLWFSARSHRPTGALFGALGALALFSIFVFISSAGGLILTRPIPGMTDYLWLDLLHPSALFLALSSPNFPWPVDTNRTLLIFGASHLLFCALLLWSATRNLGRTLSAPIWQTNAVWVDKLRARQVAAPSQSKAKASASGALLTDLPLDQFVRFSDPLLAREVKSRFRLRRAGFWVGLVRFALFLVAAGVWLFEVFWLLDASSRSAMAPYALRALLYGGTLCLAVLSATSWTRERESGTWESLKLSLLAPRQILRAKWLSPLISFGYYAAPLLLLMPIGAFYIDLFSFLAGALVVGAWLGLAVALGLWMSWRVKNGASSIAWTAGVLAMLLVGLPWLNSLVGVDESLATWKYGASGYRDADSFYPYNRQPASEKAKQLYKAETGRTAPSPLAFPTRPAIGQSFTPSAEWEPFRQWGSKQVLEAEEFKARLNIWHPGETLNRLFAESDQRNISSYTSYNRSSGNSTPAILASTLFPLAVTLLLLALLRRDVRREQLG